MKYKSLKLNFRMIAKTEPMNMEPCVCQAKTSFFCKYPHLFLKTRESQVDCFFCLRDSGRLNDFKLEAAILPKKPKPRKKKIITPEGPPLSYLSDEAHFLLEVSLTGQ